MKGVKPRFSLDDTAWFLHNNCVTEGKVIEISIVINRLRTDITYCLSYGKHFTEKKQTELYLTEESLIEAYEKCRLCK